MVLPHFVLNSWLLFSPLIIGNSTNPEPPAPAVNPLAYVDPFIGTGGHGHTFPGATTPFGMVQLSPDTRLSPSNWDGCSGYHYSDEKIYGFSHTHLSGTGIPDYCDILVMPYTAKGYLDPQDYGSGFDRKNEHAEPGYYKVQLDRTDILAELTATEHVGVHRYTFPSNREIEHLVFDLRPRDKVIQSSMTAVSDREVVGFRESSSWAQNQKIYFAARFSKPFFASKILDMTMEPHVSLQAVNSTEIIALLDFYSDGEPLVVTVGISAVSVDAARKNLQAECNHFDFDQVKDEAQRKWLDRLSVVNIEAGSEKQLRVFYTALYHSMIAPNLFSDVRGTYRGLDGEVHTAKHPVYTVFSLWDTYRAAHPLYTILAPDEVNNFVKTFLLHYEQGGRLPVWELAGYETDCMIGNHSIPVVADAYLKGISDYDARKALEAMVHTATLDLRGMATYDSLGYIPSDLESESVSKTLEYTIDDWSIGKMAERMGQPDIAQRFYRRSLHYRNILDPETRFFRARANGSWHAPFDPYEVNFNYTEANAWQYRFTPTHDMQGMIERFGGNEKFEEALDELFTAKTKTTGRDQADITGLIGQYVQGNEPSHHIAYLYNYVGRPDKTQEHVRIILDSLYSDQPDGLSGNEDCGQMSAWLVFSAMGFYPVNPVGGEYIIGTPWFEEMTLTLPNGKAFRINAPGVSSKNKYIKSVTLNGRPLQKTWITHRQITSGGTLDFEMSDKPQNWGRAPESRPTAAVGVKGFIPAPYVAKGNRVFKKGQEITLATANKDAKILYRIKRDTNALSEWKKYRKPIPMAADVFLNFKAVNGEHESAVQTARFYKLQEGLKIHRLARRFENQYTAGGENALIDRIRGGNDFRSGGWQGYQGVDLEVVIDRGSEAMISSVSTGFLQDENSWIFFPKKVIYEYSTDGETFTTLGELENPVSPKEKGGLTRNFELSVETPVSARYIRVKAVSLGVCPEWHKGAGNPCWIFVDEVSFR